MESVIYHENHKRLSDFRKILNPQGYEDYSTSFGLVSYVLYCVNSIYAVWHIEIALSSHFVASSVVVTLCILDSISKMACQI